MTPETVTELLKVAGNAGVLWVACVVLVKTLKHQYEKRIEILEAHAVRCDADRGKLHEKIETILFEQLKSKNSKQSTSN